VEDNFPPHQTIKINSQHLQEERVINIYLPPHYAETTDSFLVLYMPDGGVKEDFPHIAFTLNKLILDKSIRPVILVGIENTQRRRDLTGPTEVKKDKKIAPVVGGSEAFRAFISNELMPVINSTFRTTSEKGILGESLAGLFVVETFLFTPEIFDYYIAFDPSLWWNNHKLVKEAQQYLSQTHKYNKTLWIASSNATDIFPHTQAFTTTVLSINNPQLKYRYDNKPEEKHNTIFRATKEEAFKWVLGL